jgi:uncharacterized protein
VSAALDHLAGFTRALRAAGVPVALGQVTTFLEALSRIELDRLERVYWAGRITLLGQPAHIPIYDRVFGAWFAPRQGVPLGRPGELPPGEEEGEVRVRHAGAPELDAIAGAAAAEQAGQRASGAEILRAKTFAMVSPGEAQAMERLRALAGEIVPRRLLPRLRPARRGRRVDMRRSLRRAVQSDGEVMRLARRRRRLAPRRLLLLIDVSGSMQAQIRPYLLFAHALAGSGVPLEAFAFGTRLTRLTPALRERRIDRALAACAGAVLDWEGGTRIGEALGALLATARFRNAARGALILILSDGLERGDPAAMVAGVARLARLGHRLFWLSPLLADARYRPRTRALRAVLPILGRLHEGSDLASLHRFLDRRRPGSAA